MLLKLIENLSTECRPTRIQNGRGRWLTGCKMLKEKNSKDDNWSPSLFLKSLITLRIFVGNLRILSHVWWLDIGFGIGWRLVITGKCNSLPGFGSQHCRCLSFFTHVLTDWWLSRNSSWARLVAFSCSLNTNHRGNFVSNDLLYTECSVCRLTECAGSFRESLTGTHYGIHRQTEGHSSCSRPIQWVSGML
jgi:hypothetical protein